MAARRHIKQCRRPQADAAAEIDRERCGIRIGPLHHKHLGCHGKADRPARGVGRPARQAAQGKEVVAPQSGDIELAGDDDIEGARRRFVRCIARLHVIAGIEQRPGRRDRRGLHSAEQFGGGRRDGAAPRGDCPVEMHGPAGIHCQAAAVGQHNIAAGRKTDAAAGLDPQRAETGLRQLAVGQARDAIRNWRCTVIDHDVAAEEGRAAAGERADPQIAARGQFKSRCLKRAGVTREARRRRANRTALQLEEPGVGLAVDRAIEAGRCRTDNQRTGIASFVIGRLRLNARDERTGESLARAELALDRSVAIGQTDIVAVRIGIGDIDQGAVRADQLGRVDHARVVVRPTARKIDSCRLGDSDPRRSGRVGNVKRQIDTEGDRAALGHQFGRPHTDLADGRSGLDQR